MISVANVKKILKESNFIDTYKLFLLKKADNISASEYSKLLTFALLMFRSENSELQKFGYNVIVSYSIYTKDFIPLYEISLYNWNTPVIKLIQSTDSRYRKNGFFEEIEQISAEYLSDRKRKIYYTEEQIQMNEQFVETDGDAAIIAPTSFGKTELLKDYVARNYKNKNICIIVPTKVLINQLRADFQRYFKESELTPKIITHFDMKFNKDSSNIFILTQERLFKLVFDKKTNIVFDTLLIDEAHNVFDGNERGILLAKTIILLKSINNNMQIKYFSPIIENYKNLVSKYIRTSIIREIKVQPLIKVNHFYLADFKDNKHSFYDDLLNEFIDIDENLPNNKYDFILAKSKNKNLLYFNSPSSIRREIHNMLSKLPIVENDTISEIITSIKEYVHKDYDLVDCVNRGVVYHYGVMPDNVRMYIEECTKKYDFIKYVFCTSTLLEGVNMPFDKMFICEIKKGGSNISYHQLKNLIGRVNRYSTIFNHNNGNVENLLSEIYFIRGENSNSNYNNFIKERLSLNTSVQIKQDKVTNPLLVSSNKEVPDKEKQYLSTLVDNINIKEKHRYKIETDIGKAMLESNIIEFDIKKNEDLIQERINKCNIEDELLDKIFNVFIEDVELISDRKMAIYRLRHQETKNYYKMFLNWRMENASLSKKISMTVNWWKNHSDKRNIFVGDRWGNKKRNENDHLNLYIDIMGMTDKEIVNYAVLRLKEEDEYVDYVLMKFVELLYKFGKVKDKEYNLIQYGTDNIAQIYFLKDGLSSELSELLVKKYNLFVEQNGEEYKINNSIISKFDDNKILYNELQYYLK